MIVLIILVYVRTALLKEKISDLKAAGATRLNAQDLIDELASWKIRTFTESEMQSDIEQLFIQSETEHSREHQLTNEDIVDFLVGSAGVECKTRESTTTVLRQLQRYGALEYVGEILVVTSPVCAQESGRYRNSWEGRFLCLLA